MLTHADAIAQDYMIDYHAPGRPIAYKGPRFAPTAVVGLYTEHECQMREALQAYELLWLERVHLLGELSPELQALRNQAATALRGGR